MVESIGNLVIYMGKEYVLACSKVCPVFGVHRDTEAQNVARASCDRMKSFAELVEEARKSAARKLNADQAENQQSSAGFVAHREGFYHGAYSLYVGAGKGGQLDNDIP